MIRVLVDVLDDGAVAGRGIAFEIDAVSLVVGDEEERRNDRFSFFAVSLRLLHVLQTRRRPLMYLSLVHSPVVVDVVALVTIGWLVGFAFVV